MIFVWVRTPTSVAEPRKWPAELQDGDEVIPGSERLLALAEQSEPTATLAKRYPMEIAA